MIMARGSSVGNAVRGCPSVDQAGYQFFSQACASTLESMPGVSRPFSAAATFCRTCAARRIPGMTVDTWGDDRQNRRASSGSVRTEEHTSELQSLAYLVCRLLLEKKKKKTNRDKNHR